MHEEQKLVFLCGVGNCGTWLSDGKQYSRNFRQGYRVYDSHGLAAAQNANGGGFGSTTGLYLVRGTRKG